jgi:DTW domain-containing protein YfiP
MSRRNNAASRCDRCRMHSSLCVCPLVPALETRTRLVLVIHRAEDRKPTNTGRLAVLAMKNSEVLIRGRESAPTDSFALNDATRPLFLFPHEDAVPLDSLAFVPGDDRPVTLIVPDGNWRQASKVRNRVAGMKDVPCVSLPIGAPSTYRLRTEAHPFGLATVEAIGRCLRVLEGSAGPEVERALLHVFRAMVDRTLWSRGEMETHEVTGGIPEGTHRHDPRSGPGDETRRTRTS